MDATCATLRSMVETSLATLPDGRRLAYVEHGASGGVPVFVFHGTPASRLGHEFTDKVARALDVRVIVPDRPGIGRSDPSPTRSLLDWGGDVVALADALGLDRFGVLGYSGGGPYALACAHTVPDRLLGVTTMAGVGPLDRDGARDGLSPSDAKMLDVSIRSPGRARLELRVMAFGARLSPASAIKSFAKECAPVDQPFLDTFDDLSFFVEACRGGARGVVLDYRLWGQPWGFDWSSITTPVRLYQGTADTIVPMHHAEDLAARLPSATVHALEGEGHISITGRIGEILAVAAGR